MKNDKNNLEKRIQVGGCSASIFANEVDTENGKTVIQSVLLQRTYMDKDGKYQNTNSYRLNDLPKAQLALQKAFEYLSIKDPKSG